MLDAEKASQEKSLKGQSASPKMNPMCRPSKKSLSSSIVDGLAELRARSAMKSAHLRSTSSYVIVQATVLRTLSTTFLQCVVSAPIAWYTKVPLDF